ncbi:MAG: hypothetical protein ACW98Y_14030 [Candidatus Thorarchaeota archaeon]|jgi:hypothetical protein
MNQKQLDLRLKPLLKILLLGVLVTAYVVFPIWSLLDGIVLRFTFVLLITLVIPSVLFVLIDVILKDTDPSIELFSFLSRNRIGIGYFVVTIFGLLLVFFPLIISPLQTRGDEPVHIVRIIYLSRVLTFGSLFEGWFVGIGIIILLGVAMLLATAVALGRVKNRILQIVRWFFQGKKKYLLHIALTVIVLLVVAQIVDQNINTDYISRFGPLHPLTFSLPYLLFGNSTATVISWKIMSLLLIAATAFLIRTIIVEVANEFSLLASRSLVSNIIASLAGWLFLMFPAVIDYTTPVYLTAGVVFFFVLNCFLFFKYLRNHNLELRRFILIALMFTLGFGSLWKRVIMVQAGAIVLLLFIDAIMQPSEDRSNNLKTWFKSAFLYAGIFGPWFIIVQLGGFIWRDYQPDASFLLYPQVFDYAVRFDLQYGYILGLLGYSSLVACFIIGFYLRSRVMIALLPLYSVWYLFFNLDAGWPHHVDRFFVPVMPLFAISMLAVVSTAMAFFLKTSEGVSSVSPIKQKILRKPIGIVVLVLVLSPFMLGMGQNVVLASNQIQENYNLDYLPYDQAAYYIDQIAQGNDSLIYSNWGPSSLSFYLNQYGDYSLSSVGFGVPWSPEPDNITISALIEYAKESGYEILAFPTPSIISSSKIPTYIIEELILSYQDVGVTHMEVFTHGSMNFYIWLV